MPRTYIAIDLKSFYASVECVERGLDPLRTNLVVADESRTEKTICLAVSPSLKAYGISGRARLFEVVQRVREINRDRLRSAPGRRFSGSSFLDPELQADPSKELAYIVAPPRMALYMETSRRIYDIYLGFVAPSDIVVYSVDEVFIDATEYLRIYSTTARDFTARLVREVLAATGITATAGIGPNLYLAKIAMDIEAKHSEPDADGVRIATLDEMLYRRKYWLHRPLTDFWRVGRGTAARLESHGIYTMGDIARASLVQGGVGRNEELLYKLFGVNAELLIDHAWGWEPTTMEDIKAYAPTSRSLSSGQVLSEPYPFAKARTVLLEMADQLVLEMVEKRLLTDKLTITVCYDVSALSDRSLRGAYKGEVGSDWYGRPVPKPSRGTVNLGRHTSSTALILKAAGTLFDRIASRSLPIRRMYIVSEHILPEDSAAPVQLDLFETDGDDDGRERKRQEAILAIRRKYGRNAILKGMNFEEGATARERNKQIGGHKA